MDKFKLVRQHDAMQCGVACLKMIGLHFGIKCSSEYIASLCVPDAEGVANT